MVSTVTTSTASGATWLENARKSFHANGRFWAFFSDATNMIYWTSIDGINWTVGSSSPIRACTTGQHFCVWFDGIYVHYVYCKWTDNNAMYYRRGTPNADGSITWSFDEETVKAAVVDNHWNDTVIVTDSNGVPWISYTDWNPSSHVYVINRIGGSWGASVQLDTEGGGHYSVLIVPLTSGKMFAFWDQGSGTPILGKLYDGASWGALETCSTENEMGGSGENVNAVSEGDHVHLVFLSSSSSYSVRYRKRTYGTGWGDEVSIQTGVTYYGNPSLAINPTNSDLYCFWQKGVYSPAYYHIFYKKCVSGTWDADPTDWVDETTDTFNASLGTSFYQAYAGCIGYLYLTLTSSPYNVRFAFLGIAVVPTSKIFIVDKDNNLFRVNPSDLTEEKKIAIS